MAVLSDNVEHPPSTASVLAGRAAVLRFRSGEDYIKRVIGKPGDRVACCDEQGRVTVQPAGGQPVPLDEADYLFPGDVPSRDPFCEQGEGIEACPAGAPGFLVPEDYYWMMGDHWSESKDSRPTRDHSRDRPEDKIVGRAFVKIFPVNRVGGLGVPNTFKQAALGER